MRGAGPPRSSTVSWEASGWRRLTQAEVWLRSGRECAHSAPAQSFTGELGPG